MKREVGVQNCHKMDGRGRIFLSKPLVKKTTWSYLQIQSNSHSFFSTNRVEGNETWISFLQGKKERKQQKRFQGKTRSTRTNLLQALHLVSPTFHAYTSTKHESSCTPMTGTKNTKEKLKQTVEPSYTAHTVPSTFAVHAHRPAFHPGKNKNTTKEVFLKKNTPYLVELLEDPHGSR
jgi:hypothetical protein